VVEIETRAGKLTLAPEPVGTRGYDDLRWQASREPLGRGLRPQVASPGDLARMLGALDREDEIETLLRLRRHMELERRLARTVAAASNADRSPTAPPLDVQLLHLEPLSQ
jgi:hypothetical protein